MHHVKDPKINDCHHRNKRKKDFSLNYRGELQHGRCSKKNDCHR